MKHTINIEKYTSNPNQTINSTTISQKTLLVLPNERPPNFIA
ncbi:hypothetical protein [Marinifilum fragile]|nr:hypothetical protein [Marinifilum fragile]